MNLLCYIIGHRWRWMRCERCDAWRVTPSTVATPKPTQRVHTLKIWPQYYAAVSDGSKPFELRRADREYSVGDHAILAEWDPMVPAYTGRRTTALITYILPGGQWGLAADHVILGIRPLHSTGGTAVTA